MGPSIARVIATKRDWLMFRELRPTMQYGMERFCSTDYGIQKIMLLVAQVMATEGSGS
jgi:hypothetical protein